MRCMKKIENEKAVETLSIIKLVSSEGFNEEDHPRDNDGVFVDKDGGSSQSKKIRDRVIDRYVKNKERRIKKLEGIIQGYQENIDDPDYVGDNDMNTKDYLQYSVTNKKEKIIQLKDELVDDIKNAKERKEQYDGLNLIEMSGIGKNTHDVGSRGFKNGTTKSLLKDWKLELGKRNYLSKRDISSYDDNEDKLVRVKEWEDRFKGKTLIDSNVKPSVRLYGTAKELEDEIMFFWNDVMTDDQRSGVDVLKIYWSTSPQYESRQGGKFRTLGTHGGRKGMEYDGEDALLAPSVLTMNISPNDTLNDVLNTLIHEVSHSQWSNNVKTDWGKTNKFTEKILALGREGAITNYAGSYFDDLEEVHKKYDDKWEKTVEQVKNMYGTGGHQTEKEGQNWKNEQILDSLSRQHKKAKEDIRENIAKVERLIANETHSEYFAMVSAPTDKEYHAVDTVKLQEMSKLIKENLYG
jgi:hypothetical protein